MRALYDAAPYAIVVVDETGVIESLNAAAEELFGHRADAVAGAPLQRLFPELPRTLVPTSPCECELSGCSADGIELPLQVSLAEMIVDGRRYVCCFARDLTAIRRAESQLRQAQKMEAIGTLASGVAHDFNNLLMGVSGCASIALECVDGWTPARTYLEEIKRSSEGGIAITRQLLALARGSEARPLVLSLNQLVRSRAGLLGRLLGEDVDMMLDLGAAAGRVRADPGLIEQVLLNLTVNARDAMPRGGRLTLATALVRLDRQEAGARQLPPGRYVMLSVADEGTGISPDVRERIFEPFFTTKEPGQGTGLGLPTVYAIVEEAGGSIAVDSDLGVGTTVEILLPHVRERITREIVVPSTAARSCAGGTVLVVEDDRLVRMSVRHFLEGAGYKVLEARTGAEAVDCCRNYPHRVDVLVSDVVLPGMGGEEIAQEVARFKPGVGVILVSAYPAAVLVAEGRLPPGAGVLQKPFAAEELLTQVAAMVGAAE
jgi:PAS domain S-box-containing protein